MCELLKTPLGERFKKLCELRVIAEEAQGYIESLLESGRETLARTEILEWVRIGKVLETS